MTSNALAGALQNWSDGQTITAQRLNDMNGALGGAILWDKEIGWSDSVEAPYDDLNNYPDNSIVLYNNGATLKNCPDGLYGILLVVTLSGNLMKTQYISSKAGYFGFRTNDSLSWGDWITVNPLNNQTKNELAMDYAGFDAFETFGFLGDSYTQGSTWNSASTWKRNKGWPEALMTRIGLEGENYGVGGSTTKSYYGEGTWKALTDPAKDGYSYCWGINDASVSTNEDWDSTTPDSRLGTEADIVSSASDSPANTFYGYYSSIIRKMMEHAPNAKHTIIGIPKPYYDANETKYNDAAKKIAEVLGIPFIDPHDDEYFASNEFVTMNNGHPTWVGYVGMSHAMQRLMQRCIANNVAYYKTAVIG